MEKIKQAIAELEKEFGAEQLQRAIQHFYEAKKAETMKDDWSDFCHVYGLAPSDLGRKIIVNGKAFTLSGIKPNNRKYPILGKNTNGTLYKFDPVTVKKCLV